MRLPLPKSLLSVLLLPAVLLLPGCELEATDPAGAGLSGDGTQVTCVGDDCYCQPDAICDMTCAGEADGGSCAPICDAGSACAVDCGEFSECGVSCASAEVCEVDCNQTGQCLVACPREGCAVSGCNLDLDCFVTCPGDLQPIADGDVVVCAEGTG